MRYNDPLIPGNGETHEKIVLAGLLIYGVFISTPVWAIRRLFNR